MKINKDRNWKKFFIRITIILSIIVIIINFIILSNTTVSIYEAIIAGIFFAGVVWAVYYVIRWLNKGLQDENK